MTAIERQQYNKSYWIKNRARLILAVRKYHSENRESSNANRRKWYWDHRELVLERAKDYYNATKGKKAAYNRKYRLENKDKIRDSKNEWRRNNREYVNSRNREYASLNPDRHKKWNTKWRKKNPHKIRAYESKRRNFEKSAVTDLKSVQDFYLAIEHQDILTCTYCGKLITRNDVRVDHIIPISRGGHHTADNLAVSCHWCNTSKNDRLLSEWPKCPPKIMI